ncbi:MAG: SUMF1/EgtB/PvdO family nonheme iron enzyme [Alphaproteobacteria bacterium]|nr:SUMF1/EgtB/PvdO family nonheme iron enzyme [Alphaproteobacteria bacterium]
MTDAPRQARLQAARDRRTSDQHSLRVTLEKRRAQTGTVLQLRYTVPVKPPFTAAVRQDCARHLGRLRHLGERRELDVPRSVRATLAAAGRFSPQLAATEVPTTLLVLIDVEQGDHPFLQPFQRLLLDWRRQGVRIERWTFGPGNPTLLTSLESGVTWPLEQLARHRAQVPMWVFSRALVPADRDGLEAPWLGLLRAWPMRAWIDANPTPLDQRDPVDAEAVRRFVHTAGLPRFPFTAKGLLALCDWFSLGAEGAAPDAWEDLPNPGTDPALDRALWTWAALGARVPDATWDQLQHFREGGGFPELSEALGDARALQLLWDRIALENARAAGASSERVKKPETSGGRALDIHPDLIAELERRCDDPALLARADALLLRQLGDVPPEDELELELWTFRRARHLLELGEAEGERLMQRLLQRGATHREVGEWVARKQDQAARTGRDALPASIQDTLDAREREGEDVPWREVLTLRSPLPLALELGAAAVVAALTLVVVAWPPEPAEAAPPRPLWTIPQDVFVQRRIEGTPLRPAMVDIPAGRFMMGSPDGEDGHDDDEVLHEVLLTRSFLMAETEVTQGQYRAVMGVDPMQGEEFCEQAGLGHDLPVVCVSWLDAVAFCNRLSELEGLTPAYVVEGEGVRQVPEADGYRLPTEAEWEFAARAGTADRWAGTDEASELARFANLGGDEDGYSRLAPVREGSLEANGWGLHHMSGNAWEWVWDWYTTDISDLQLDPVGPSDGSNRVIRGGSWRNSPARARVATRSWGPPSRRLGYLGFRVSRSLPSAL